MTGLLITIIGLFLSVVGSILMGWAVIQPRIWITGKARIDMQIKAVLEAARYADTVHPKDDNASTDLANKLAHSYLNNIRQEANQKIGYFAVEFLVLGFVLQGIGLWLSR